MRASKKAVRIGVRLIHVFKLMVVLAHHIGDKRLAMPKKLTECLSPLPCLHP
jgi:hypothetical protein